MKFSIGDKVHMKNTGEEGVVVAYISNSMFEVEVNGVTFPVYADQLEHPYLKWFTDKVTPIKKTKFPAEIPVEKVKERKQRLAKGIYLSFFPQFIAHSMEDVVESLRVYLLNELPVSVTFSYKVKIQDKVHFMLEGQLHAFSNLYMHQIDFELMNDSPRFMWRLTDANNEKMKPEEDITRIRPEKMFGQIGKMLQENQPSFEYKLIEDFSPLPPKQPGIKKLKPVVQTMNNLTAVNTVRMAQDFDQRQVIDLHIEKLMPDVKGLSNSMMMDFQIAALQRALQSAIVNHQEYLIVIHGVGTGALKEAVHKVLSETPEVKRYSNEWLGRYGFGATKVIFKR